MGLNKSPYRGTRDFFPHDKRRQNYIFDRMSRIAQQFGYEPYDGPLLEEVDLYKAKSGEELINEQIYSFTDRGERFVAIRPEMTPTLARMVAQIHKEYPRPIRWYAIPNLMRYEKPQRGRLREHWQFNCDIFGAPDKEGEIEILQVIISLLENFGANEKHFEILLNDRHIVDGVFNNLMKVDQKQAYKLYKIIDKAKKVPQEALHKMLEELSLNAESRIIFEEYLALKTFKDVYSFLKKYKQEDVYEKFQLFIEEIQALNLEKYISYDPTIVRGLDYYTGIVFEVFDKDPKNRRALCGGGSYANLLQIFNEPALPGTGFGLGDVTLTDFLETHNLLPNFEKPLSQLFLSFQDESAKIMALNLAQDLRKKEINVTTHLSSLKMKKVFPLAEKKGASFVALMGDQEVQTKSVQIKKLSSKEQINFKLDEIDKITKFILG